MEQLYMPAAVSFAMALIFGFACPGSLARNKWLGIVLGAGMLFLIIPHIEQLFAPETVQSYGLFLRLVAGVLLVLLWGYGDYLFARAFAIACIYLAWWLLQSGYAAEIHPCFSILFFLFGILGIVLGAKPFWMRDWLDAGRSGKHSTVIRWGSCGIWGILAVIFLCGAI